MFVTCVFVFFCLLERRNFGRFWEIFVAFGLLEGKREREREILQDFLKIRASLFSESFIFLWKGARLFPYQAS